MKTFKLADLVAAIESYEREYDYSPEATAEAKTVLAGWLRSCTDTEMIARTLVRLVRDYEMAATEKDEIIAELEDKIDPAATDIEHAVRFGQPDLIRDAYRTLTGHLLYA